MASDQSEIFPEETITYNGMKFVFRPPNGKTKKAFTSYLESVAVRALARHRMDFIPEDYATSLRELTLAFGSKCFNWGTKRWTESLNDDENVQELAFIMLSQESSPNMKLNEIDRATVSEMWDQPYFDEGDLFCQQLLSKGVDQEYITIGSKIANIITNFINRPNSPAPAKPGQTQSSTTTSKSVPDSQTNLSA